MKTNVIVNFRSIHKVLLTPMTEKELKENVRKDGTIQAKVLVDFNNLVNYDIEELNDEVSDMITDSVAGLTDISYKVAGRTTSNDVILKVTANVEFENL